MPALVSQSHFLLLLCCAAAAAILPHQEDQVERFQRYLRISTAHPNPNYASAVDFLSDLALSAGFHVRSLEFVAGKPLLLLSWLGSDPSLPSILLNSHVDSVPAEPSKWDHPPFSAHRDLDGRIFARGSQDDKCLAIQYIEALCELKASGFVPRRSIHISLVPDEEIGGADGAARFAASEEFRELNVGFALDEGQASTSDEFRVFYADRSPWSLIVRAVGPPGHGSRMFDDAALENLMWSAEAIASFRESQFDLVKVGIRSASEVISVNPVYMKAGTPSPTGFVMNVQPSEGELGFDVRLPPTADANLLRKRIAEELAPASRNLTFELAQKGPILDHVVHLLSTPTNSSNPWWSIFEQAIFNSDSKLAKPEVLSSTTDARFLRQQGIPTLGFSPMANTPILLHDHNEFLKDTVFLKGIEVYKHLIRSLSTAPAHVISRVD